MTCRDLVLMASDYSATAPDAQSTTSRDDIGSVPLALGQASRRSAGKKLQKGWNRRNGEASSHVRLATAVEGEMVLHFSRVGPAAAELEIWSASEGGFSFVISNESRDGPGLHGKPGFVASWRPIHINKPAIRVGGSPFKTFAEAETACEAMLPHLTR
jgi:hypothetical protein